MFFREVDFEFILETLVNKRWEGYEYVALLVEEVTEVEDIELFYNESDAIDFCSRMAGFVSCFSYLPIRTLYRTMSEAKVEDHLMVSTAGIVDIGRMVELRDVRLRN